MEVPLPSSPLPSIKEVARKAGVSIATVSRVVTNSATVEKDTKERVLKVIRELNYVPNLLARGLKEKSGGFIGLVLTEISHEFFSSVINYVEDYTSRHGFTLILANTKGLSPETETRVVHKLLGRKIDGLILLSPFVNEQMFHTIRDSTLPLVLFDCYQDSQDSCRVLLDDCEAGRLAGEHLAALGHRQCFCVTGPWNQFVSQERLRGFRDALSHASISLEERQIFKGDFEFASGRAAARAIVENGIRVTAIWAQNDLMAIGAMSELQRKGVRVPEQISVVGMDNLVQSEFCNPRLTTVNQPIKEMARRAVELLFEIRDEKTDGRQALTFKPELVIRDSTRSLKKPEAAEPPRAPPDSSLERR